MFACGPCMLLLTLTSVSHCRPDQRVPTAPRLSVSAAQVHPHCHPPLRLLAPHPPKSPHLTPTPHPPPQCCRLIPQACPPVTLQQLVQLQLSRQLLVCQLFCSRAVCHSLLPCHSHCSHGTHTLHRIPLCILFRNSCSVQRAAWMPACRWQHSTGLLASIHA